MKKIVRCNVCNISTAGRLSTSTLCSFVVFVGHFPVRKKTDFIIIFIITKIGQNRPRKFVRYHHRWTQRRAHRPNPTINKTPVAVVTIMYKKCDPGTQWSPTVITYTCDKRGRWSMDKTAPHPFRKPTTFNRLPPTARLPP